MYLNHGLLALVRPVECSHTPNDTLTATVIPETCRFKMPYYGTLNRTR